MKSEEELRETGERVISEIRGARLSSVQFVLQDYVILGFDAKGALTTLVWPEITGDSGTLTFGMPGYRDRLCGLITEVVDRVKITADQTVLISFENKSRMAIPLRAKLSGERIIFNTPGGGLFAW